MPISDKPSVSVLLPVRNGQAFIAGAVASILAQTYGDFELLVLDDGSSDRTGEIVEGFRDGRVRLVPDRVGRGLAIRLNQGIDLARGRFLARMDADDLSFPERLEKQVRFLESHPQVDVVSARALVFRDGDLKPIGMLPFREEHNAISARPWRGFYMPHPAWMGRAQWFRRFRYRLPEVLRAEDQELLLRALPESRYHSLPDVLLAYRQGPFNFRKTLIARRHFLASQLRLFLRRGELGHAAKALGLSGVKLMLDTVAALPGCGRAFFARMGTAVPKDVEEEFRVLARDCFSRPTSAGPSRGRT